MKRRALGATLWVALISALTGSLAWGSNPHGTPPGQTAKEQSSASVAASASVSAGDNGQANKADDSSASASNGQANKADDSSASASASTSASAAAKSDDNAKSEGNLK